MQSERQINDLVDQRFRLIEYIGGGGGGDVFKALDTKHADKPVAIKLLRSSFGGDSKARQELFGRFNQEVWTTARLGEHPAIVTVLDSGVDHNQPYLVMEFLGAPPLVGTGLSDLIHAEGSIEPRRAVHLMKQVCSGLHYAHCFEVELATHTIRGIVHRDVKPSNIFVLQDPMLGETVRILDFGISKTLSDITVTHGTQLVGFIGTLQYASPEQLRGKALDARSDIYSLGAVMYEMLTGDTPLFPETNTFPGWYEAHNYQPIRPFIEACPSPRYPVPPALEAVILSCLEKTPDKRPPSMQVLSELLEDSVRSFNGTHFIPMVGAGTQPGAPVPPPNQGFAPGTAGLPPAAQPSPGPIAPLSQPTQPQPAPVSPGVAAEHPTYHRQFVRPEAVSPQSQQVPSPQVAPPQVQISQSFPSAPAARVPVHPSPPAVSTPAPPPAAPAAQVPVHPSPPAVSAPVSPPAPHPPAATPSPSPSPTIHQTSPLGFSEEEILALDGVDNLPRLPGEDHDSIQPPVSSPEFLFGFDQDYSDEPEPEVLPQELKDFMYGFEEEHPPTVVEEHPGSAATPPAPTPPGAPPSATPQSTLAPAQSSEDQSLEEFLYSFDQDFPLEERSSPTVVETAHPGEGSATYLESATGQAPPQNTGATVVQDTPVDPVTGATVVQDAPVDPVTGATVVQDAPLDPVTGATVVQDTDVEANGSPTVVEDRAGSSQAGGAGATSAAAASPPTPAPPAQPTSPPIGRPTSPPMARPSSPPTPTYTSSGRPTYNPSRTRTGYTSGPMTQRGGDSRTSMGQTRTRRTGRTTSGKNQTLDSGFSFWMKSLTSAAASLIDRKSGSIPLLKTLTGHRGWVMAVAFSPDGQVLATASGDASIRLWDPSSGKLLETLEGHGANVTSITFSPDGRILASGSEDRTIRLWGVATGKLLRVMEGHEGGVRCLAFSPLRELFMQKSSASVPGMQQLASGGDDRVIKIWDVNSGNLMTELKGHTSVITSLAFNQDGGLGLFLASASSDKTIRVWDISNHELIRTLEGHTAGVWSVAFSPTRDTPLPNRPRGNKTLMVSGGEDRTIRVWDISSGRTVHTFSGHTSRVRSVVFSPDGSSVISGSGDKTLKVWDMASGKLISTLSEHKFGIWSVAFCPTRIPSPIKPRASSYILASGSGDNTTKLWLFTRF